MEEFLFNQAVITSLADRKKLDGVEHALPTISGEDPKKFDNFSFYTSSPGESFRSSGEGEVSFPDI